MTNSQFSVLPVNSRKGAAISPSDKRFERLLDDNSIYLDDKKSRALNKPLIDTTLKRRRPSLSHSGVCDKFFEDCQKLYEEILNEGCVMDLIDTLCGRAALFQTLTKKNVLFDDLEPMLTEPASRPRPDLIDGVRIRRLNKAIRDDRTMHRMLIPTGDRNVPAVPNFVLEAKAKVGNAAAMKRQACYYAAHGVRAIHRLQNYRSQTHGKGNGELLYDGNAYTFSCAYHAGTGTLQLYAHHVTEPATPQERPSYHMTQLGSWAITGSIDQFRDGVTALRNIRELACMYRNQFVNEANARVPGARPSPLPAGGVQAGEVFSSADGASCAGRLADSPKDIREEPVSDQEG